MKKIVWIIAICCLVAVIAAVVIGVVVPEMQKNQKNQKRAYYDKKYTEQIEKNIENFKKAHPEISCDIRYSLVVSDSGYFRFSYRIKGDSVEKYADRNRVCYGFDELFEFDEALISMDGELYINDSLIFRYEGLPEEIERVMEERSICDAWGCDNTPISGSNYCGEHRVRG